MGFTVPTLAVLVERIEGDLNSRMGNSNALIRRSLPWVLSRVLAGVAWGLYGYQSWIADQTIPDTAEAAQLVRWARIWGLFRTAATKATGTVVVTAVAGAKVYDGEILQRADREEYVVTNGPEVGGHYEWAISENKDVTVEAVDAGADGNYDYDADASLAFVSPTAGVVSEVSIGPEGAGVDIDGGADEESDDSLLARLLARLQNPPQGGSAADYEGWAQAALSTVDRVWVFGPDDGLGDGEVDVYFTMEGTGTGVLPTTGVDSQVETVDDYITDTARKPVAAEVTAIAPTGHAVELTITLVKEDGAVLADVQAAILAELESMFRDRAEVAVASADLPNSYLTDAIGDAAGVDSYTLDAVDGGPGTDAVTLAAYEYPTIIETGITWS